MFNQDALFKGYKKRLEKLPKAKAGSEGAKMVRVPCSLAGDGAGDGACAGSGVSVDVMG